MTDAQPLQHSQLYNTNIVDLFDWSLKHKVVDACDLRSIFDESKNIKVLSSSEKGSISETVIMLGSFRVPLVMQDIQANTKIAIKMSFAPKKPKLDNSLEIERKSYQLVTNPLLLNGHSPNLMLYVGAIECKNFKTKAKITSQDREVLMKEVMKITAGGKYDLNRMWLLILEQGEGMSLGDVVYTFKKTLTWENFWHPVLFQIMYTLLCFQQVGFAQNDLHAGNVWIDIAEEPRTFVYQGDESHAWTITTRFIVKFFDFDRAAKSYTKYNRHRWTNNRLDDWVCEATGQCNGFSTFFDAFNIIYNIYHHLADDTSDSTQVKRWIKRFIDRKTIHTKYAWGGQLCTCVVGEPGNCDKCERIEPDDKNILDGMVQKGFEEYMIKPQSNDWRDMVEENAYVWRLPSMSK